MRAVTITLQCFVVLLILGIGLIYIPQEGAISVFISIVCAVAYLVSCIVASKFAFSRREFYICNKWELIKKKVGLGLMPAFVVFLILYFILFASWN